MTSIAQIVRKIIDDLSDGVSELVLLVVVLAEQNAELPEQLPPASEIVNNTANTLAKIARELGRTDYKDFPEIGSEINEAADAVDAATSTMGRAVRTLEGTGDRKQGWNGLVDACRIMSGKTIRLLQIVYGADLKRLQLTADALDDFINNMDSHRDLRNPNNQKRFAGEDVPTVTNKALTMARQLQDKANDSDSPFTKDLLNRIAKDLGDKAQKLVDAGNAALRNPDLAPGVDKALDDLRGEIKRAKDAIKDLDAEPVALSKLRDLSPLLDAAEESVAQVPKVLKSDPKGYERAQQKAKDDVGEVIKTIRPNPKLARDADKLEQGLKDQILAARNALRDPGNPENNKALDRATKDLLDALNNLRKANPDKKLTPQQREDFQKALENMRKLFDPKGQILKKPEDQEQEAYQRLKDDLVALKNAIRNNDPKTAAPLLKRAANNANNLADQMRENAKNLPPYQRQKKEDAANDIQNLVPKLLKKGVPAMKNLNDGPAKEDLMDAIRRLKRAGDRGNVPKDEKDLAENWKDILNGLRRTNKDAGDGNKNAIDPGLSAIRDALNNLKRAGERLADRHPNPQEINKPLAEMDKLFDQYKSNAPAAASGNAGALNQIKDIVPKMEKLYDDLNKATRANDIRPIQDVEDAIDRVGAAVDTDQPSRIAPAGKELAQKIQDLGQHIDQLKDPRAKAFGDQVMDQLKPGLRDLLMKAKEATQNPDKPAIADEFNDIANKMKEPLARLKEIIDPKPFDRSPEATGAAVKKAIEDLRKARENGDPAEIRKALDNLRDKMNKYNDATNQAIQKIPDERKRKILEPIAKEGNELDGDLKRVDPTDRYRLADLMDRIPDNIDDFLDTMRHDAKDDAITGIAKVNNMLATLGSIADDDMDLGDLLDTAGQLSNYMRGLIGDATNTARKFGTSEKALAPAAKAALDLDKLLRQLEGGEVVEESSTQNLNLPVISPHSDSMFERIDIKKARTFDEVAAAIASQIHDQAKSISKEADNIAVELANLAKAARSGNRTQLLIAAKAASAHIIAYCKQLTDLAAKIPGRTPAEKMEQHNLIRYAQGLRNYGTQLKILCSVKAASIEESRDTDATLSEMTKLLGEALRASLTSMATTQQALLPKRG